MNVIRVDKFCIDHEFTLYIVPGMRRSECLRGARKKTLSGNVGCRFVKFFFLDKKFLECSKTQELKKNFHYKTVK